MNIPRIDPTTAVRLDRVRLELPAAGAGIDRFREHLQPAPLPAPSPRREATPPEPPSAYRDSSTSTPVKNDESAPVSGEQDHDHHDDDDDDESAAPQRKAENAESVADETPHEEAVQLFLSGDAQLEQGKAESAGTKAKAPAAESALANPTSAEAPVETAASATDEAIDAAVPVVEEGSKLSEELASLEPSTLDPDVELPTMETGATPVAEVPANPLDESVAAGEGIAESATPTAESDVALASNPPQSGPPRTGTANQAPPRLPTTKSAPTETLAVSSEGSVESAFTATDTPSPSQATEARVQQPDAPAPTAQAVAAAVARVSTETDSDGSATDEQPPAADRRSGRRFAVSSVSGDSKSAIEPKPLAAVKELTPAQVAQAEIVAPSAAGGEQLAADLTGEGIAAEQRAVSKPEAPATQPSADRAAAAARFAEKLLTGGTARREAAGDVRQIDPARFVQRVAGAFARAQQRDGEIRLRLSPPELGSLKVQLKIEDGALTARLEAETSAARGLLLENLPALRERLAEQNIRIESFEVDLQQQQDETGTGHSPQEERHGAASTARRERWSEENAPAVSASDQEAAGMVTDKQINIVV